MGAEGAELDLTTDVLVDSVLVDSDAAVWDIAIDPVPLDPVDIVDAVPVDLAALDGSTDVPPDAQTFGGPVGIEVIDPVVIIDDSMAETGSEFPPKDDGSSSSGDDQIFEPVASDGGIDNSESATEEVPGRPVDPMPEWRTLDGAVTDDVTADDGSLSETDGGNKGDPVGEIGTIDITMITDKDGSIDDTGSIDDGAITDGSFDWTYEDFVKPNGEDGTPALYTLDPDDALIYQTMGPVEETPGRPSDPMPEWRTNTGTDFTSPVTVEVRIDRAPVNYAASDFFHTDVDLL